MKWALSQNVKERPHNITSILNIFKSLIKQVYQKKYTQKFSEKKDQKVYFTSEISRRKEKLLTLKSRLTFDNK